MSDLLQMLVDFWVDVILFVPRLIFWSALQLLEMALTLLPPMDLPDPSILAQGFSGELLYFLTLFQVPQGLGLLVPVMLARFILRRIPFLG